MYEFTSFIIGIIIWGLINYFAAKYISDKNPGLDVNPTYYVVGTVLFGGIWPLLFLFVKYLIWRNKNN